MRENKLRVKVTPTAEASRSSGQSIILRLGTEDCPHSGTCGWRSPLWRSMWSAVAQLVECRTRNRESPGSNPRCYRLEVWAFSFTSRRLSRLSCINEYLAIDSGGNVSE